MHTHFKIALKWSLHFSKLVITRFNNGKKLFQAKINAVTLRAILLLNTLHV